MESKLTLRLDYDLKERVKHLAHEREVSVSRLVGDYFRLLLRKQTGAGGRSSEDAGLQEALASGPVQKSPSPLGSEP